MPAKKFVKSTKHFWSSVELHHLRVLTQTARRSMEDEWLHAWIGRLIIMRNGNECPLDGVKTSCRCLPPSALTLVPSRWANAPQLTVVCSHCCPAANFAPWSSTDPNEASHFNSTSISCPIPNTHTHRHTPATNRALAAFSSGTRVFLRWAIFLFIAGELRLCLKCLLSHSVFTSLLSDRFGRTGAGGVRGLPV